MEKESWIKGHWRPLVAVMYILIILFDFIIAPTGWTIIQASYSGVVGQQWQPITLQGGGLFHIAINAVLGVSSFTRGQEKLERLKNAAIENTGEGL